MKNSDKKRLEAFELKMLAKKAEMLAEIAKREEDLQKAEDVPANPNWALAIAIGVLFFVGLLLATFFEQEILNWIFGG